MRPPGPPLRVGLALVWLLGTLPAAAGRQDAESDLPAAEDVIARSIDAVGGREAVLKYRSRTARGRFDLAAQGISGDVEIHTAAPDLMIMTVDLPGLGRIATGFDGTTAWSTNPMTGPMILEGRQGEQARHDADFYAVLQDERRYRSIRTSGRVEFDGRECYRLEVVRHAGAEDTEFYDARTGLMAGTIVSRESPMGPLTATTVLSDYRQFDDLLLPTRISQTVMGVEQVMTLTSIEHDAVDPSVFEPPPAIRALVQ